MQRINMGGYSRAIWNYMLGYDGILPEQHFQNLYGAGFSGLPRELGGQMAGDRSRLVGTPNE